MADVEQSIASFEATYLPRLKNLATMVDENDLETLPAELAAMDKASQAVSAAVQAHAPHLQPLWNGVLKRAQGLLPSVEEHLQRLRRELQTNLNGLTRGRRVISGYQQNNPGGRFDSSG